MRHPLARVLLESFEKLASRYGYVERGRDGGSTWYFVDGEIRAMKADKPRWAVLHYRRLGRPWLPMKATVGETLRTVTGLQCEKSIPVGLPCGLSDAAPRLWLEFEPEKVPESAGRLSRAVVLVMRCLAGDHQRRLFIESLPLVRLAECVAQGFEDAATFLEECWEQYQGNPDLKLFLRRLEAYRGGVLV